MITCGLVTSLGHREMTCINHRSIAYSISISITPIKISWSKWCDPIAGILRVNKISFRNTLSTTRLQDSMMCVHKLPSPKQGRFFEIYSILNRGASNAGTYRNFVNSHGLLSTLITEHSTTSFQVGPLPGGNLDWQSMVMNNHGTSLSAGTSMA